VQLYGRDLVGSIPRPLVQLLGYARVSLAPGASARVELRVPARRFSFTDRRMVRVVEPGEVEVWIASHAAASAPRSDEDDPSQGVISNARRSEAIAIPGTATARARLTLTGPVHEVGPGDRRIVDVTIG